MDWVLITIPRTLLGIVFIMAAIDGFHHIFKGRHLMKVPPITPRAEVFIDGLEKSGFFWPFKEIVGLAGGLMLIANVYAPVGLLLLLPIIVVVVLMHFTISRTTLPIGIVLVVLTVPLLWSYRSVYCRLFE